MDMTMLRATSYATRQDLAAYIACRDGGGSSGHCTSTPGEGDNGVGAWGDATWRTDQAWCALGLSLTVKHRSVRVTLFSKTTGVQIGTSFECAQGDKGDEGIIDLNPGCLKAAGLDPDTELDATAQVEFLDQAPSTKNEEPST